MEAPETSGIDPQGSSNPQGSDNQNASMNQFIEKIKQFTSNDKYMKLAAISIALIVGVALLIWLILSLAKSSKKEPKKQQSCTINSDCKTIGEYCNTTTKKCTACPTGIQPSCPDGCSSGCLVDPTLCTTNSDCTLVGQYCNTTTKKCTVCPT